MKIARVDEMRAMDRFATEKLGIPEEILMENAGLASAFVLNREIGIRGKTFSVLCGGGNNGGDGFVVARKIHADGGKVKVFILGDPGKYKGAAQTNYNIVLGLSVEVEVAKSVEDMLQDVLYSDVIIDGLFGTGLDREVRGLYADAIDLINESGKMVLSLDIPSGINGDTGEIMGVAVNADLTVTYGLPKIGNLLYPGYERAGRLYVCHISFPPDLYDREALLIQVNDFIKLPPRNPDGHKGSMGEALFIAGAASYFGAPYFSALSFLKAGGGYSRLAAPYGVAPFIAEKGSEIVLVPQSETVDGTIARQNREALLNLADKMDCVVIGPGLSLQEETQHLVRELVALIGRPVLIDGDGITALAGHLDLIRGREGETILTPHLGEMSRLTGKGIDAVRRNRIDLVQETAKDLRAFIVLKGAHSLIGTPEERVYVNLSGNSGMATAGSGDVLTGTIAAMCGLGLDMEEAARKGVFLHGLAGDLAAGDWGEDGTTAQTILDYLPLALKMDREGPDADLQAIYKGPEVV
ncbi:MAG: NAD(P)H-hydrate dehydratase [Syntrophaceae bacterium]|nr:NAD(P)H-hydrate dehydratase [Syntrophaceae bacterium]